MKLVNPNDPSAKRDTSINLDIELDEQDWKEIGACTWNSRDDEPEHIKKYVIEKVNFLLTGGGYTEIMDFDCRKPVPPDAEGPFVIQYENGEQRTVKDGQIYVLGWNKLNSK